MSSRNQKHEVQKLGKQQWLSQRSQSLATEYEMRGRVLQTRRNLDAARNAYSFAACERCARNPKGVRISNFLGGDSSSTLQQDFSKKIFEKSEGILSLEVDSSILQENLQLLYAKFYSRSCNRKLEPLHPALRPGPGP